jgi:predicted PurR-regulated permease PerM
MHEPHSDPRDHQEEIPTQHPVRLQKRWLFFGIVALVFVAAYCIVNRDRLTSFFSSAEGIGNILSPLFIGCIIAYLVNPILKFYEYFVFRKLKRKGNLRLFISIFCAFLTAFAILAVLVAMVIPELYKSIKELVTNYQTYLNGLLGYIQTAIDKLELNVDISDMEKLYAFITEVFGDAEDFMSEVLNKLQNFVFDSNLIGNVWGFLGSLFSSVVNAVLGLFIAFYILSSKEKRVAQLAKFRAAHFSDKQDAKFTEVVTLVDKTFGGYFKGVLVDALIVGVTMFLALSVCRVSNYNLLIATICAITNVIPVFGPLIGAIPSGIIILMTNPEKLIWFIIIVLIIQQLDGNILVPLIQGNNTGISSLAVLVAITVMGGLFDIPGMIFGVPIFAVVIELCKRGIEEKLRDKNKETDTTHYYRKGAVGNAEEEVYYEHAHWKYKYDHSRIKPHVDKVLAALVRLGKRIAGQDGNTPLGEADDDGETERFEDTAPAMSEEASAAETAPDGENASEAPEIETVSEE